MTPKSEINRAVRGYSWPPFEAGNTAAVTHGVWSARKVSPLTAELITAVQSSATRPGSTVSYLADPSYALAVKRWATLEARCELIRTWLDDRTDIEAGQPGDIDEDGEVRPAADLLVRLEGQAAKAAERLGLDPLSRSKLGRDVAATAVDLTAVAEAGAAALAARSTDDDDDGENDDDE